MGEADDKSNPAKAEPDRRAPARAPKKDTTALSNALRANLQRRKQALRARKQDGETPGSGPAAEDEATWTR